MVDDEELPIVVSQLELPAREFRQALRRVGNEDVQRRGHQPAWEVVGAQEVPEHPGHLLRRLGLRPLGAQPPGLGAALDPRRPSAAPPKLP